MKKIIAVSLVSLVSAGSLAACGTSTTTKTVPAKPTAAQVAAQAAAKQAAAKAKAAAQAAKAKKAIAKIEQQVQQEEAISTLKSMILKNARTQVSDGYLSGPIKSVSCTPATSADSAATEATFDCMAVTKTDADGTQSGYGYTGAANYATGEVTAHIGNN